MPHQKSAFGSIEYSDKIARSLRVHAQNEPLFESEADVAEKLIKLMKSSTITHSTIRDIRDSMLSLDQQMHYDGSGWFEMKLSVEKWIIDQSH